MPVAYRLERVVNAEKPSGKFPPIGVFWKLLPRHAAAPHARVCVRVARACHILPTSALVACSS